MKYCTLEDLKENFKTGCHLHFITGNEYTMFFPAAKTEERIPLFINALIGRLEKRDKNVNGDGGLVKILKNLPLPYDIWHHKFIKETDCTSFWTGKPFKKKEDKLSAYLIFNKKLSNEEAALWNMFIVGYYVRPNYET